MKSLVAFYSRTNVTKKLAEDIASRLDADVEEIIPKVSYNGKMGYVRGGKDAIQEKAIDLEPLKYDPQDYDVVYLGCPVWASRPAAPLFSYIKQNEGKFSNVKFFITAGGSGHDSTLKHMEEHVSMKPLATLALTTKEVKRDLYEYRLMEFLE